ncbi:hypothetical protein FHG66_18045 [Rubellimicrobium rubrum]|uniref:Uncharacterized protein n=1 Tax=Rubellimicrobium rubrum TaxID=2585369 RepID=A0A5C4MQ88_9RHOB|nr:hypothetical protein [Rubellimicrobium rubrum]TNC46764.1 hypothetical protein FHG66_18045 [Rubellimicrobium rubrum]
MGQKAKKIVPKKIGKVKIPKRLRKTVNKALANPRANEAVTAALLAVGTALAKKTFGQGAAGHGTTPDADGAKPHAAKSADTVADLGTLVAGAAGEAVRGVAGAVTRIVEEAVDTIRRDFGPGRAAGAAGPEAASVPQPPHAEDTEAGAQSEPVVGPEAGATDHPPSPSPSEAEPAVKVDGDDSFGDGDDNEDPFDGNDSGKTGPMSGVGP